MLSNQVVGEPRLVADGAIHKVINDLAASRTEIMRLAVVVQYTDRSIAYIRASDDESNDDVLSYIGMLDFAKMGYFQGLQSVGPEPEAVDSNGLVGDVGWAEEQDV